MNPIKGKDRNPCVISRCSSHPAGTEFVIAAKISHSSVSDLSSVISLISPILLQARSSLARLSPCLSAAALVCNDTILSGLRNLVKATLKKVSESET